MVEIGRFDEFGSASVENCPTLKSYEVVAAESELKDVIDKIKDFPLLVCVIPSAEGDDGSYDNVSERNTCLFFVIEPYKSQFTKAQRVAMWERTQQGMKELKEYIHENESGEFVDLFRDTNFDKRQQDPEFNFMGMAGWSLAFDFMTDGF